MPRPRRTGGTGPSRVSEAGISRRPRLALVAEHGEVARDLLVSASISSTSRPSVALMIARFVATVVLPDPPLMPPTTKIMFRSYLKDIWTIPERLLYASANIRSGESAPSSHVYCNHVAVFNVLL